jgi:hypothetical protein
MRGRGAVRDCGSAAAGRGIFCVLCQGEGQEPQVSIQSDSLGPSARLLCHAADALFWCAAVVCCMWCCACCVMLRCPVPRERARPVG